MKTPKKNDTPFVVTGDQSLISKGTMYWLYRSKKDTVVFSLEFGPRADSNNCTFTILERRHVELRRTNSKWPYPFNAGFVKWNSGSSTSHKALKGLKARCRDVDIIGLTGYGECSSENKDLTQGMMLSRYEWSDDLSDNSPALEVEIVTAHALFDANVFTQYKSWSASPTTRLR
jgi:hypothetical protein